MIILFIIHGQGKKWNIGGDDSEWDRAKVTGWRLRVRGPPEINNKRLMKKEEVILHCWSFHHFTQILPDQEKLASMLTYSTLCTLCSGQFSASICGVTQKSTPAARAFREPPPLATI